MTLIRIRAEISALLGTRGLHGLHTALQTAIELEHATIPPYLYALYSLAGPAEVADILRSVVAEEMLHMTLAANIMNAIGGRPVLDSRRMLPRYPGPLPGTVEGDLVVGLAPFSVHLVTGTFMRIERPEHPFGFGIPAAAWPADPTAPADQRWAYAGAPVTVDQSSVYPVPVNPVTADYPDGSAARRACVTFNYTYTRLLKSLHAGFNGNPGELGASSIPLMMSLRRQATDMMSGATSGGVPAGPTFDWQPADAG